jgi:hypothetical protein
VNERKEFFRVGIKEIADEVRKHRAEIMITLAAEAEEYRKILAVLKGLEAGTVGTTPSPTDLSTDMWQATQMSLGRHSFPGRP